MLRRKALLLLFFSCICLEYICGQDTSRQEYTDIGAISMARNINKRALLSYLDQGASLPRQYSSLVFSKKNLDKKNVADRYVTQKAIVRFNLINTADTARSIWFFPGLYFSSINLYRLKDSSLSLIPVVRPAGSSERSYRLLTLAPHDSLTVVAELSLVHTHLNRILIDLIQPEYLSSYFTVADGKFADSKTITFVFCGLLLMMILFSLATFFQEGTLEFLYYAGYAFFLGLMLFIKALYTFHTSRFGFFQEGYLDFIMQSTGILFYMLFMKKYLATRLYHPILHKLYNWGIGMLGLAMFAFTYVHYFTYNFVLEDKIENATKILLIGMTFVFLVYSIRHWHDKLLRYLFWGNLWLLVFSMLSLLLLNGNFLPASLPQVFRSSIFYYEIGILIELIFFLMGLNYKNRRRLISQARERERLKAENQMNEYEKEIAVYKGQQQERERISADMHDELGSGMTAIRLMSEIARNKMKENTPVEIEKISQSADEVLNKMNAIIWSMNSGNDTVDNLVSYIRVYATEYFEYTPIDCRIYTPDEIEPMELTGEKRRNLFLCVKESLNNALKHSKASELKIYFRIDDILTIKIVDNGVGIDMGKIRQFGNGLKNLAKRMENIGGTYSIENDKGTVTTIRLKLGE